jgi:hypothetical protein
MSDFKSTPPWQPIDPPAGELPPSPEKLRMVIDELDVTNAPRYQPNPSQTWCNIFATDVIQAMGHEPGHWVRKDGNPALVGQGIELNANGLIRWMAEHGPKKGWIVADRQTATDAAARGHLVLVGWDSKSAKPGHVAIMLPEGTIAQAGRRNFVGETIRSGFGQLQPVFFVQMHGGSHQP